MRDILGESLRKLKKVKTRKTRMIAIVLVLSFVVSLEVFWWLRQPGLTLAGDADCGIVEHTHDEECLNGETPCEFVGHVHDFSCYSDVAADVETQVDWQKMFEDYAYTGNLRKDLVGIAKMQVGYSESKLNFEVGSDGVRRGYNRYGAWYGTPYTDWSAIFVSFCLHYAGADPNETPGNTGANSMANVWKSLGKYFSEDEYKPVSGVLVFFKDNTVGIVAEMNAFTLCVIRGDVNGAVQSDIVALNDESIAGWGLTMGDVHSNKTPTSEELLDITNGPAFFIFENGDIQEKSQLYSLRTSREIKSLAEYLKFITIVDEYNHELPKDDSGKYYIARADTAYKLTLSLSSPNGFVPGTYQYQLPDGLAVNSGTGTFVLNDGTYVGDWSVTEDGAITFIFNNNINNRTGITISATMGIVFSEENDSIDFDGEIDVTVLPPVQPETSTKLGKWGSQGKVEEQQDKSKIYWTMQIIGQKDSIIPGNIITDEITTGDHRYTQSDIDAGLKFVVGHRDLETGKEDWYAWDVDANDPNLTWTETGWTYKMPTVAKSKWHDDPVRSESVV